MPTVNIPTYDYEAEAEALKRRQAMADAMQMNSLRPMDLPTQPGVKASPLQALGKLMEAYVGSKSQEKLKEDRTTLGDRYAADTASAFDKFDKTNRGSEAPVFGKVNPDGTQFMEKTSGDSRKAVLEALASRNPAIREYAMKVAAEQAKGALTPKDLAAHATNESVLARPNDPGSWKALKKLEQFTPGNVLADQSGTVANLTPAPGAAPIGTPGMPSGPGWGTRTLNGDVYQETGTGMKKLDNAPKVNVTNSPVIAGQKAGLEQYWKKAAEHVDSLGQIATQATNLKQSVAELKNLDGQGVFSNATSGVATLLTNLGQVAGVKVDTTKLGNTEAYNAVTTDLWQGLVAKYGGNRGVTKEEAVEIKKMLPLAASSPQARQQLFQILDNVSNRQIQQYTNANKSFAKAVKLDDPEVFAGEIGDVYMAKPVEPTPVTPVGKPNKVLKWGEL